MFLNGSRQEARPEPIRLVVWDLDDTFWHGTLAEGGIREYVGEHHAIVIELARRGIVSSICSKNDRAAVETILRERGLWDYFVFPSIDWSVKGPRLARLVADTGLRPPTILYLDDHPANRAEAAAAVPGIQVADETCIGDLLADPLLAGKDDRDLSRLRQYRVLEARRRDEEAAGGANDAFLRGSDIQVEFEYDVGAHLDRAIELINRTNQLNFTKRRLPEDAAAARRELREQLRAHCHQAALIRVTDRYGEYGYCGFYLRTNGQGGGAGELIHYCFSCRILGMFIEEWVFDHLGCPELAIVPPVLTDLAQRRSVDWVRLRTDATAVAAQATPIPEVRMRGGCEIDALSHYFSAHAAACSREANIDRGPCFVRKDCSHHIVFPGNPPLPADFLVLAQACGFTRDDFASSLFAPCAPGTLIVCSTWGDLWLQAYRHKPTGRLLTVDLDRVYRDVHKFSSATIERYLTAQDISAADRARIHHAVGMLRRTTKFAGPPREREVKRNLVRLVSAAPAGSRMVFVAAGEIRRTGGDAVRQDNAAARYNRWLRAAVEPLGAKVFAIDDHIRSDEERLDEMHVDRIVYFRLASAIVEWAARTARRP
jgi:FkbH-like protein